MTRARWRFHAAAFAIAAFVVAFASARWTVGAPGFTDAYYHLNAGARLAAGDGLTDTYLWTYIGAPEVLPASGAFLSHLYWMPMSSLLAALGMTIAGMPGDYAAAQLPIIAAWGGLACIGFALGARIGGTPRHAWAAGVLTLFSPFHFRFMGTIETFAPYGIAGAGALIAAGMAAQHLQSTVRKGAITRWGWPFLAGALTGLAHLTRADGVLIGLVAVLVWLWFGRGRSIGALAALAIGYALVMLPWFARNLEVIGSPLPLGGAQTIWLTEYNDLFKYPPINTPATLFADGAATSINSRLEAVVSNLGTFAFVEGMIALTPFIVIGAWTRWRDRFWQPAIAYAVALHLVMTIVFPFPGTRGGLFHSSTSLIPFWGALGIIGLDEAVAWIAKRRRNWRTPAAARVFTVGIMVLAITLSVWIGARGRITTDSDMPPLYQAIVEAVPDGARVLINDPAALYYYTGLGGAVLPDSPPEMIAEIARRYRLDYVMLESAAGTPAPLLSLFDAPPDFLTPIPIAYEGARLYAIRLDG